MWLQKPYVYGPAKFSLNNLRKEMKRIIEDCLTLVMI
jgi:hypothetical protein